MPAADIINTIGITAYMLLLFLFLWLTQIPGANKAAKYWIMAVVMILLARINMQFLGEAFSGPLVKAIYVVLLNFEKYFLLLGLLVHIHWHENFDKYKKYGLIIIVLLSVILVLIQFLTESKNLFALLFSIPQSIALVVMAYLVYFHSPHTKKSVLRLIAAVYIIYSLHWLSFTIALHIPLWLSLGFVIGNFFNLIVYLFLVYLELFNFQYRLVQSEKAATASAKKAMAASEAKSVFLANMSHELRTPMNGVIGMLGLLKKSPLNDKQQRQADIAHQSGKNLLLIINDILDFSKIEAGQLTIEKTETHLFEILTAIKNELELLITEKNLKIDIDINALKGKPVLSDPVRVKQIVTNLVGNAIKFTEMGGVIVKAWLEGDGEHQIFYCEVTDTGIGLDEANASTLFNAFKQADESTTRSYGGTGLGLSICKNLCELMGGDITVTSRVGEGSCFRFWVSAPAL